MNQLILIIRQIGHGSDGWVVPGIAPSRYPPGQHTPGTPCMPGVYGYAAVGQYGGVNIVVGLRSVAQLTSEAH